MAKYQTTPVGESLWAHVSRPNTKWNKDGVWEVSLILDGSNAEALKRIIDEAFEDNLTVQKVKNGLKKVDHAKLPYRPETDENGNETDRTVFHFKRKVKAPFGDTTITVVDSKGKRVNKSKDEPINFEVGNGSSIAVSYKTYGWYTPKEGAGITLDMNALQLIKYVEADFSFGFDAQEDGFSADSGSDFVAGNADEASDHDW